MESRIIHLRYQISSEIGRGGMGVIYRAHDTLLDRDVAIKLLSPSVLGTQGKARLLHEAQAAAKLNHPNIVTVYDAGEDNQEPFIVMELVEGRSLHDRPPQSLEETLSIARQVCLALEHAHANGIIHRDMKPENILVTNGGAVKLMDFGLARSIATRLSVEGTVVGTVFYLAPEQALGQEIDGRTDLYALGVMLYELTSGKLPFTAEDPLQVISQHIHAAPPPPSQVNPGISPEVETIILKLLAKNPADRFKSATDLLFALNALDQPATIVKTRQAVRHNLPVQITHFIGREREINEVLELLQSNRLVTLTGVGGTGKTRLGLQAAEKQVGTFADGVWLVELAPILDPNLVVGILAVTLDLREEADRPLQNTLADFLVAKDTLLVLDNCEHLIQACSRLAENLLKTCPKLKILATSREALGIAGEVILQVPSLSLPQSMDTPETQNPWQYEAMQLFHDRVLAVQPAFTPSPQDTDAAVRICTRLDGIPLAIELAAAKMRVLSMEQIAGRLNDRFRLLRGGSRSALPRQQTLQAMIDWSFDLLTEPERILLRRLSIFPSGWTLEAAEAICVGEGLEGEDILDLHVHLVDKSMIIANTQESETRYRMLETIRTYSLEKLVQSCETAHLRDQHLEYFSEFTSKAYPHLWLADQIEWLDRLDSEHDNLRSALDWSLDETGGEHNPQTGLRLAGSAGLFWMLRGYWSEGVRWLSSLLQSPAARQPTPGRAQVLVWAGIIITDQGNPDQAQGYFEEVVRTGKDLEDLNPYGLALFGMARVLAGRGDRAGCRTYMEQCMEIFKKTGFQPGFYQAQGSYGSLISLLGEKERGRSLMEDSLQVSRKKGYRLGMVNILMALAETDINEEKYTSARRWVEEALEISTQARNKPDTAAGLRMLAVLDLYLGNYASSRSNSEETLAITREMGNLLTTGSALNLLGEIARVQGDYEAANRYYLECLELVKNLDYTGLKSTVLGNLGYVAHHRGDLPRARAYFLEGLSLSVARKDQRIIANCLAGLAGVLTSAGQPERAARLFGAAKSLEKGERRLDYVDQVEIDRNLAALHRALDEATINRLFAEGSQMSQEEAIRYASEE